MDNSGRMLLKELVLCLNANGPRQITKTAFVPVIARHAFFGYISAAGAEDDWTDPEVWKRANPSFGITISEDQFAEDCREA
jgi:hypothetical protein